MQTGLFILSYFEEKLLTMETSKIITFLADVTKTEDFLDDSMFFKYKKEVKKFKINEELKKRLVKENKSILTASKKRIMPFNKEHPFEYFIKSDGKYEYVIFEN